MSTPARWLEARAAVGAALAKALPAVLRAARWEEGKHPRADDGKFGSGGGGAKKPAARKPAAKKPAAKKPAKPDVGAVAAAVAELRKSPTPQGVADFHDAVSKMTVQQLGELKKAIGVKASGRKAELVSKIKERALAAAKAKPAPKQPAAKKPAVAAKRPAAKPAAKPAAQRPAAQKPVPAAESGPPMARPGMTGAQLAEAVRSGEPGGRGGKGSALRGLVADRMGQLSQTIDFEDGVATVSALYTVMRREVPDLQPAEMKEELAAMAKDGEVELHILNEAHKVGELMASGGAGDVSHEALLPTTSRNGTHTIYGYVAMKRRR